MAELNQEVYEMIRGYVKYLTSTTLRDALRFSDVDDLTQDVVEKFIKHDHLAKFDENITSLKYHVMNGCKTTIIDLLRKEKYRRRELRLDAPLDKSEEDESISMLDMISGHETTEEYLYLADMLAELKGACKEWGEEVDLPMLGRRKVSAYAVYLLFLAGFKKSEIGQMFHFSPGRAKQLVDVAERTLIDLGHKVPVLQL